MFRCLDDCTVLQKDINSLQQCAVTNKICFHLDKCKILSSKMSNLVDVYSRYSLADIGLEHTFNEKDLGVQVAPYMKWNNQHKNCLMLIRQAKE